MQPKEMGNDGRMHKLFSSSDQFSWTVFSVGSFAADEEQTTSQNVSTKTTNNNSDRQSQRIISFAVSKNWPKSFCHLSENGTFYSTFFPLANAVSGCTHLSSCENTFRLCVDAILLHSIKWKQRQRHCVQHKSESLNTICKFKLQYKFAHILSFAIFG